MTPGPDCPRLHFWSGGSFRGSLWVLRKGKLERSRLGVPARMARALNDWLELHPGGKDQPEEAPLFVNLHRSGARTWLRGNGIWRIVQSLGKRAGVLVWPHGLRHTGITEAIGRAAGMGAGLVDVLKYSGHAPGSLRLLVRYDDNRKELQEEFARRVADEVE